MANYTLFEFLFLPGFSIGMLVMGLLGGLIVFLIIRPWIRPIRRSLEASHELSIAKVKTQIEEEKGRTIQAATTTQRSRSRLIHDQGGNDEADIQRKSAFRQAKTDERIQAIRDETAIERARTSLIEARAENDRIEIERRVALKRAGINPDALSPRQVKRRLLIISMVTIGLFIIAIAIRTYFSK